MKFAIFVFVIIGAWAHQESAENNMNMLHARRLAGSSLRSTMERDLCLPYALCLMGTMDIAVAEHKEQFPTWAHGLLETVLPLLQKFAEFKTYVKSLPGVITSKFNSLVSDEDAEDDKTFRHLLAAHKVGRKVSSRTLCAKLFSCPADVKEDLIKTDDEATALEVATDDAAKGRFLGLGCPPVGSKFCGAFWLACNFNGLVGGGIPGNACNFAALFCNAPAYICAGPPKTTAAPVTAAPVTVAPTTAAPTAKDLPK
jgi:hypothetical protein